MGSLSALAAEWWPYALFWLLLFLLMGAEALRPLHRAPREGRGRLATNFGLGLANVALISAIPVSTIAAAAWAQGEGFGLLNRLAAPAAAAIPATFLLRSLATYLLHRLSHRLPLLWRMHRVHHGDTAVDFSTGFRHHPFELAFALLSLAALSAVAGLSVPALVVYEALSALFMLWGHANLRLPSRLDRGLRWLLVTPAMHHVHHSAQQAETDSNYGDVFSVWDRLFGTYRDMPEPELCRARFGLGDVHDATAAHLGAQLLSPVRRERSEA